MPTVFVLFGFRFMFYSNDHLPIHIHAVKGEACAKFRVVPDVCLEESIGLKPAELKLLETVVEENSEVIIERWNAFFNGEG